MKNHNSNNILSEKIELAINIAAKVHEAQHRKSVHKWQYVSHCYNAAMILGRAGFSDDVIIAGVLHDVLEEFQRYIHLYEVMLKEHGY